MKRLLVPLLATACITPLTPDETAGEQGRAEFHWESGRDLGAPIASGSTSAIYFSSPYSAASAESADANVATFSLYGGRVNTAGVSPGETALILLDGRGAEIDRVRVTVAPTVSLESYVWGGAARVTMLAGDAELFHVGTIGPGGVPTVGVGAVSFTAEGQARVIDDWFNLHLSDAGLFGGSEGHGSILATADGALAILDVDFVSPFSVTSIDAAIDTLITTSSGNAEVTIKAVPHTPLGEAYGAGCAWTTSSPALRLESHDSDGLGAPPAETASFAIDAPGTYTATCTVGMRSATVRVSY
jgi:hypothetical protein